MTINLESIRTITIRIFEKTKEYIQKVYERSHFNLLYYVKDTLSALKFCIANYVIEKGIYSLHNLVVPHLKDNLELTLPEGALPTKPKP